MHSCICASDKVVCRYRWRRGAMLCACSSITHRFRRLEGVHRAYWCLSEVLTCLQGWLCFLGWYCWGKWLYVNHFSWFLSTKSCESFLWYMSRCRKLSALVLLCSGTTSCLAFDNTNVRKQRTLPFWCINYQIFWKLVNRFCLFWKPVNLLKLLTQAENQGVMSYSETEV